ncbi:MAG: gliding motility-associated C-terminal domain-containing protein, partial [Bacteroidota bacterium]
MNQLKLIKTGIIIGLLLLNAHTNAQIYSPDEVTKLSTRYNEGFSINYPEDSIIVVQHHQTGNYQLNIESPDGTPNWNFTWYAYSQTLPGIDFGTALKTENAVSTSFLPASEEGGYAVIYTNGTETDTAFSWLSINDFRSKQFGITYQDEDGQLLPSRYTCDYLELRADVYTDTFTYYNRYTFDTLYFAPYVAYTWTSNPAGKNPNISIPIHDSPEIRSRTYEPPTDDTHYYLQVTDQFGGITKRDTVYYETIHTKAVLDSLPQWITFEDGTMYYNNQHEETMSAPFTILFSPAESENAHRYVWNFGDGTADTTYYNADSIAYTYYDPEQSPYTISLTTYSEEGCSSLDSVTIEIPESELHTPPFFTPNGDGLNDHFRVYDVSIHEFEITIFNRWGRVVHKFRGNDIRDWIGWDGKVNNTNQDASPGVYYFVIRATGW